LAAIWSFRCLWAHSSRFAAPHWKRPVVGRNEPIEWRRLHLRVLRGRSRAAQNEARRPTGAAAELCLSDRQSGRSGEPQAASLAAEGQLQVQAGVYFVSPTRQPNWAPALISARKTNCPPRPSGRTFCSSSSPAALARPLARHFRRRLAPTGGPIMKFKFAPSHTRRACPASFRGVLSAPLAPSL